MRFVPFQYAAMGASRRRRSRKAGPRVYVRHDPVTGEEIPMIKGCRVTLRHCVELAYCEGGIWVPEQRRWEFPGRETDAVETLAETLLRE